MNDDAPIGAFIFWADGLVVGFLRSMGLRWEMVVVEWGYDIDG
jgi:hypothetical protein